MILSIIFSLPLSHYITETLNGRLNTLSSSVDAMSSSLITMRSEWAEFNTSLPGLKSMYEEVMMIINLLPTGNV